MPITVSVTKESGNLENPGMFSPTTRTMHFAVDYCDEAVKRTSAQDVLSDMMTEGWAIAVGRPLGMPPNGVGSYNQFELGYPANRTSAESTEVPFVVQSISGELDRSSNEVWRIRVVISLMIRNITPGDFEGRNHSAVSITSESRGVRAYRTKATLPTLTWDGNEERFTNTWITCGDDGIDGDPLDINGEPLTMPIEQTSIVLSFVIREPFYTSYSALTRTVDAMWGTWGRNPSSHVNKRNSTVLFGYPIGRLVVTNVSVTPIDMEFRRVDVTLVDDEWYHFDQMPWSTAGVIPELDVECDVPLTPPNLAVWHAKYVLWVTPIIDGFSWSQTDFPDDVWTFFTSAVTIPTP
jgi:hypothetical protein